MKSSAAAARCIFLRTSNMARGAAAGVCRRSSERPPSDLRRCRGRATPAGLGSDLSASSCFGASSIVAANPISHLRPTAAMGTMRRRGSSRPLSFVVDSMLDVGGRRGSTDRFRGNGNGGNVGSGWSDYPIKNFSSEIRRGTDLLADALEFPGERRKIVLESRAPSGFDVRGLAEVGDVPEDGETVGEGKVVHLNGSVLSFPDACYLWRVSGPMDVTLESLAAVAVYRPAVEYLFIGCDSPLPPGTLDKIQQEFKGSGIVVEKMDVMNAMGTFNILNGEDRRVVAALVLEAEEEEEEK